MLDFLNSHKPHAALLSETLLRTNHRLNLKNYNFIRTDKNSVNNGRGTGILIKNNLQFEQINTHELNPQSLEATAAVIRTETNLNILLVVAYRLHLTQEILISSWLKRANGITVTSSYVGI